MARSRFFVLLLFAAAAHAATLQELTLAPRGDVLRIAVAGDTGNGANAVAAGIARVHAAQPLDAIVLAGDNFYPCGVTSAEDPRWKLVTALTRIGVPILPVLGNHDSCGKSDPMAQVHATGVIRNWMMPARQYAVRFGVADFAMLDTTPYVRGKSRDAESVVRETFASSHARWRVVVGHHPVISSGYHGYFPRDEVNRMRKLIPALRETKANLYICGHDHHLELLRGRMLHLVSGAGSEPIPPIKLHLSTVYPSEILGREAIGFAVVELDAKKIRVRFYDAKGKPKSEWF
ncbi:MAG TPA: metallophosphoesterase [Thermoanaerobaculia bacterium]|nr:metallophosphoesterase [Thermoanaerobaculia bacterium]